jgi:hypothetical protein
VVEIPSEHVIRYPDKLFKDLSPLLFMRACLLIVLMVAAQGSVLVTEDLSITDYLEYTVAVADELPDDLSVYDVLVIATPSTIYGEDDIEAIRTFVESGGGLIFLAEENNKGGTTLILNLISEDFSITFNTDRIYDDQNYTEHTSWITIQQFPPHPVFQGITRIVYTSGCSLEAEGVLLQSSQNAYAEKYDGLVTHQKGDLPGCIAFVEVGEGRIFACGDKELFDQYLSLGDNTLFALNVFDWLAGNPGHISERLTNKEDASQLIPEVESLLYSANQKGLKEVLPHIAETAESLISEAKTLYDSYKYGDSLSKAQEAKRTIEDGEGKAEEMVDSHVKTAQQCLSSVEKGARKYLPSQYEAATYYMQEVDSQKTYSDKIDKADEASALCNEIRTGLKGAAEKEIKIAEEGVETYRGLFGRKAHHSARINLEYAQESYDNQDFGNAIEFALQSQNYSEEAAEEQKKDYIVFAVVVLICVVIVYLYVRK